MTKAIFYKQRKNRMICGVVAGLADKYGWDLPIARVLTALFVYFSGGFGIILYIILAICLPYKEDLGKNGQSGSYHQGPRKRKDAEVIDDKDKGKWFW
ncbi:PspC domain-containing protein [Streptococcus ratti]|uniref:PspC domain-containing protein n=2 Tax=Streptococcus ratti TaxID=1341 RepID=A0A7X9LC84_STRRT|nr:PspC domain-containing protein [Streptococcus ratti]VEI59794.1 phage shock protein C [Streptococcus mutans]EJN93471.1 hypothetical protein SRA_03006 [Streptococcus ratti FA-1 = DSM 20564]EMP71782.1 putative phage shock protein C [Streptococcus ratti FA-1 = DSM 20564]NMD48421.1 PspC domain-containing protein [Streptococcus ratti]QEY07348.1 PspC domain-containing protein [Streptococcus ratti]